MDYSNCMLSYGAGVNSTALAILLINDDWQGPIVFSDTGTEWPDTYCFMDYFENEWLKPRNAQITRLHYTEHGPKWDRVATNKSLIEYCTLRSIVPFAAVRWCTSNWKVRPLQAWAEEHGYTSDQIMIAIAAEESRRLGDALRPLVDMSIDRKGCIEIIQQEGLQVPRKSGCYICPFQRNSQWRELWERHPDLFAHTMALEEAAGAKRGRQVVLSAGGKISLRQRKLSYESQTTLPGMDMDALLAWKPCVCGL